MTLYLLLISLSEEAISFLSPTTQIILYKNFYKEYALEKFCEKKIYVFFIHHFLGCRSKSFAAVSLRPNVWRGARFGPHLRSVHERVCDRGKVLSQLLKIFKAVQSLQVNRWISKVVLKGAYWISSNSSVIQYCDSNIGLFSIAPLLVMALPTLQ